MNNAEKNGRRSHGGRRGVTIKDEQYQAMAQYNEMTGRPIEDMLDEWVGNCIEAYLSVDLEDLAERTASA